jgi:hypothetical protein
MRIGEGSANKVPACRLGKLNKGPVYKGNRKLDRNHAYCIDLPYKSNGNGIGERIQINQYPR